MIDIGSLTLVDFGLVAEHTLLEDSHKTTVLFQGCGLSIQ
jgi:hypothetical protein